MFSCHPRDTYLISLILASTTCLTLNHSFTQNKIELPNFQHRRAPSKCYYTNTVQKDRKTSGQCRRVILHGPTRTEDQLGVKSGQPDFRVVLSLQVFEHYPPPAPHTHSLRKMSPSDELAYLKSLVGQLTDKITELEAKAVSKKPTPAQQLRTILVGPPGAGARFPLFFLLLCFSC